MASRNPNRPSRTAPPKAVEAAHEFEAVNPRWLLKTLAITLAAAIVLGYLSVCLLVYQGGWQFLLHPAANSTAVAATPAEPFDSIPFDAASTGRPRLSGWWIPAAANPSAAPTLLFLHGGNGSLATTVPSLNLLHTANVNLFAIDYRGFGRSDGPHPTEARMQEDAEAALDYLTSTRHLAPHSILPYGQGLGAVLAASLAQGHPDLGGLIVDTPDPDAFTRVTQTREARLLPMRLLVQERFALGAPLAAVPQPKLLLAQNPLLPAASSVRSSQEIFRSTPDPKIVVTLSTGDPGAAYAAVLTRFLDEYVPATTH